MTPTHSPRKSGWPNPNLAAMHKRRPRAGVALVLVLGFLALISLLIVAFMASVRTEVVTAKNYGSESTAKQLSDAAVQAVVGTIRQATSQGTAANPVAWASQPGMIRNYDVTGAPGNFYKLYSANNSVVAAAEAASFAAGRDLDPAWSSKPALYVDLNAPVLTPDPANAAGPGLPVFPIADPRAFDGVTGPATTGVQGFSYSATIPASKNLASPPSAPIDNLVAPGGGGSPDSQRLPMPVSWLYVLRDGSLTAPDLTSTKTATFASNVPTATNPIVGRMAYWTDDETAKVNLNTAGEGTYWDRPRFSGVYGGAGAAVSASSTEVQYAISQPQHGEFQRYPGHPAQTALTPILGATLTPQVLANIIPRQLAGGSAAGATANAGDGRTPPTYAGTSPRNALYASVDELLFQDGSLGSNRTVNSPLTAGILRRSEFFLTANSNAPETNLFNLPRVSMWPVDVDVHTRMANNTAAPSPYATAFDQLTAFCNTLQPASAGGSNLYYFQRTANAASNNYQETAADYTDIQRNKDLYLYLQKLLSQPVPGFGGSFTGKYPADCSKDAPVGTAGGNQILTEIFDYIRCTNAVDTNLNHANITDKNSPNPYTYAKLYNGYVYRPFEGTIAPIHIGSTMGFGRSPTISQVGLLLICTAEPPQGPVPTTPPSHPAYFIPADGDDYWRDLSNISKKEVGKKVFDPQSGAAVIIGAAGRPVPDPLINQTLNNVDGNGVARALVPGEKMLQAAILLEPYLPSQGLTQYTPDFIVQIPDLRNLILAGQTPFAWIGALPSPPDLIAPAYYDAGEPNVNLGLAAALGGNLSYRALIVGSDQIINGGTFIDPVPKIPTPLQVTPPALVNPDQTGKTYNFISAPFLVKPGDLVNGGTQIPMNPTAGNTLTIKLYEGHQSAYPTVNGNPPPPSVASVVGNPKNLYQTLKVTLTPQKGFPLPLLWPTGMGMTLAQQTMADTNGYRNREAWGFYTRSLDNDGVVDANNSPGGYGAVELRDFLTQNPKHLPSRLFNEADVLQSLIVKDGDARLAGAAGATPATPGTPFTPSTHYGDGVTRLAHYFREPWGGWTPGWGPAGTPATGSKPATLGLYPWDPNYGATEYLNVAAATAAKGTNFYTDSAVASYAPGAWSYPTRPQIPPLPPPPPPPQPPATRWDWDNGQPGMVDGAYINKPDDGDFEFGGGFLPYYNRVIKPPTAPYQNPLNYDSFTYAPAFYTPNRIIPSPGMFGSLPTGVLSQTPWQTLLFRPDLGHPQSAQSRPGQPPDHLIMDLFWMPVVEPYAISTPLATAGKLNLNYQIVPFTYIKRETPLVCALKSEKLITASLSSGQYYKNAVYDNGAAGASASAFNGFRQSIDPSDTTGSLRQFEAKFTGDDVFRSASQICDIYLVPQGQSWSDDATADAFWKGSGGGLTGDDSRERPYADLYPRLTTKSNTYTVHVWVQSLVQVQAGRTPTSGWDKWNEATDRVAGEYRGSSIIERYIDANDSTLPDFAAITANPSPGSTPPTLDTYYKFRVVGSKRFSP